MTTSIPHLIPSIHRLVESHKISFVQKQVAYLCPKKKGLQLQRMPAMNPISLERKHIPILLSEPYVVAEKTDGVRFMLLLTCWPTTFPVCGGQPTALLFNRRYDIYEIRVMAPSPYFTRHTLLDGELVWDYEQSHIPRQLFLIFDGWCLAGENLCYLTYIQRYSKLQEALDVEGADILLSLTQWLGEAQKWAAERNKIVCEGNAYALKFQVKPIHPLSELDLVSRQCLTSIKHATDGVIFTPDLDPVRIGTHHRCFKLKTHHTLDVLWKGTWDSTQQNYIHELWYATQKGLLQRGSEIGVCLPWPSTLVDKPAWYHLTLGHVPFLLNITDTYTQQVIQWHQSRSDLCFEHIIEGTCTLPSDYELTLGMDEDSPPILYFHLLHIRYDKDRPNDKRTLDSGLVNMAQNITLRELISLFKAHKK